LASGIIRVEGLSDLIAKINGRPVYAEPIKKWITETIDEAHALATERAPKDRNVMAATLTKRVSAAVVPLWGVVSTGYEVKGVRLPFVLEAGHHKGRSGKDVKLHYRSGPRQGQSTRKWLGGVIPIIRTAALAKLADVERQIEALWAR